MQIAPFQIIGLGLRAPENHVHALGVPHVRFQHAWLPALWPGGGPLQNVLLQPALAPAHGPVAQLGGSSMAPLLHSKHLGWRYWYIRILIRLQDGLQRAC